MCTSIPTWNGCLLLCPHCVVQLLDWVPQLRNCYSALLLPFQEHHWSHRGGPEGVQHDVQVSCKEHRPEEGLGDISGTWMALVCSIHLWLLCCVPHFVLSCSNLCQRATACSPCCWQCQWIPVENTAGILLVGKGWFLSKVKNLCISFMYAR